MESSRAMARPMPFVAPLDGLNGEEVERRKRMIVFFSIKIGRKTKENQRTEWESEDKSTVTYKDKVERN